MIETNNLKYLGKRGLAMILALVLCVSMLGTAAFAETVEDDTATGGITEDNDVTTDDEEETETGGEDET